MGEPGRQYQPVDLLEFKRRLLARTDTSTKPVEDRLAELARVIGGDGRIVSGDTNSPGPAPSVAPTGFSPAKPDPEPVQWHEWPAADLGPHQDHSPLEDYAAPADPQFDVESDFEAGAEAQWYGDTNGALDENRDILAVPAEDVRLRLHRRRPANKAIYLSVAAVAIVGVLGFVEVRSGGFTRPPAHAHADMAAVANIAPASTEPAPSPPGAPAVAAGPADPDAGAQLASASAPENDAAAAAAAPDSSSSPPPSPQQNDSMFPQPHRVQTIPIYGGPPLGETTNMAPSAPVPGLALGHVEEAQTLNNTPPATNTPPAAPAAPPAPAATANNDAAPPPNPPARHVASIAPEAPARAAAKPASSAAAGTAYAAILGSATSEAGARGMLGDLQKKFGAELSGHRLTYHHITSAAGPVYLVRVIGLANDEAEAFCAKLHGAGGSCKVESR